MVYGLSSLDTTLWYLSIAGHVLLLSLLLRKHCRVFPYFTLYVAYCLARSGCLVSVRMFMEPAAYFYAYYLGTALGAVILTFVAFEVAREVLGPYNTIPARSVINLIGSVLVAGYAAALIALYTSPSESFWARLVVMERASLLLVAGGLIAVIHAAWNLGLPWDKQAKAICAGLLFTHTIQAVSSIFALYGYQARYTRPVYMGAFVMAQAVWIGACRQDGMRRFEADHDFAVGLKKQVESVRARLDHVRGGISA
jgi:hypothetical protein